MLWHCKDWKGCYSFILQLYSSGQEISRILWSGLRVCYWTFMIWNFLFLCLVRAALDSSSCTVQISFLSGNLRLREVSVEAQGSHHLQNEASRFTLLVFLVLHHSEKIAKKSAGKRNRKRVLGRWLRRRNLWLRLRKIKEIKVTVEVEGEVN